MELRKLTHAESDIILKLRSSLLLRDEHRRMAAPLDMKDAIVKI